MFCPNCGCQLPLEAKFCPNCGFQVPAAGIEQSSQRNENSLPGTAPVTKHLLTFKRSDQFFVVNPPMKILIDGTVKLSVENGAQATAKLSDGNHHIVITSSIRKKEIDIALKYDTTILLSWNRFTGALQAELC